MTHKKRVAQAMGQSHEQAQSSVKRAKHEIASIPHSIKFHEDPRDDPLPQPCSHSGDCSPQNENCHCKDCREHCSCKGTCLQSLSACDCQGLCLPLHCSCIKYNTECRPESCPCTSCTNIFQDRKPVVLQHDGQVVSYKKSLPKGTYLGSLEGRLDKTYPEGIHPERIYRIGSDAWFVRSKSSNYLDDIRQSAAGRSNVELRCYRGPYGNSIIARTTRNVLPGEELQICDERNLSANLRDEPEGERSQTDETKATRLPLESRQNVGTDCLEITNTITHAETFLDESEGLAKATHRSLSRLLRNLRHCVASQGSAHIPAGTIDAISLIQTRNVDLSVTEAALSSILCAFRANSITEPGRLLEKSSSYPPLSILRCLRTIITSFDLHVHGKLPLQLYEELWENLVHLRTCLKESKSLSYDTTAINTLREVGSILETCVQNAAEKHYNASEAKALCLALLVCSEAIMTTKERLINMFTESDFELHAQDVPDSTDGDTAIANRDVGGTPPTCRSANRALAHWILCQTVIDRPTLYKILLECNCSGEESSLKSQLYLLPCAVQIEGFASRYKHISANCKESHWTPQPDIQKIITSFLYSNGPDIGRCKWNDVMTRLLLKHLMENSFNDTVAALRQTYPMIDHSQAVRRLVTIRHLPEYHESLTQLQAPTNIHKHLVRACSVKERTFEELRLYMKGKITLTSLNRFLCDLPCFRCSGTYWLHDDIGCVS